MRHLKHFVSLLVFTVFFFFAFPSYAYAYLDLGTGSYMLQLLVAGLFGYFFVIKNKLPRIWLFFKNLKKKKKEAGNE